MAKRDGNHDVGTVVRVHNSRLVNGGLDHELQRDR